MFCPIAVETAGTQNAMAVELVHEIGRRIAVNTQEQRLSAVPQQRNALLHDDE